MKISDRQTVNASQEQGYAAPAKQSRALEIAAGVAIAGLIVILLLTQM